MLEEKFVQENKKIIEEKIAKLKNEIARYKKYSELGNSDSESALEFEQFEGNLALMENAEKELADLEGALLRINQNKYGKCSVCNQPIERGRLKAYPAATECVTHAK